MIICKSAFDKERWCHQYFMWASSLVDRQLLNSPYFTNFTNWRSKWIVFISSCSMALNTSYGSGLLRNPYGERVPVPSNQKITGWYELKSDSLFYGMQDRQASLKILSLSSSTFWKTFSGQIIQFQQIKLGTPTPPKKLHSIQTHA